MLTAPKGGQFVLHAKALHGKGNIDPTWLSDQLLRMVNGGFAPKSGYTITGWLGKIATAHPDRCVEVLNALLTSPKLDRWTYVAYRDSIELVLKTGLTLGTPATVERDKELISFLSTIGESSYLTLVRDGVPV